jgi:hypothetical protein
MDDGEAQQVHEQPKSYQDLLPRFISMQRTSRILVLGIVVRDVLLPEDILSEVQDRMRRANGRSPRRGDESKRGEVNAEGNNRTAENPKSSSHRLTRER